MKSFFLEKLKLVIFCFFITLISSFAIVHFNNNVKSYDLYHSDLHKIVYGSNPLANLISIVNYVIGENNAVVMRQTELTYTKIKGFHLYSNQIYKILKESGEKEEDLFNKFLENNIYYFLLNDYNDPVLYSTKLYDLLNNPYYAETIFNQDGWKIIMLKKDLNKSVITEPTKINKIYEHIPKMFKKVFSNSNCYPRFFSSLNENENYNYSPATYENFLPKQKGKYNYNYFTEIYAEKDFKLSIYYLNYNELGENFSCEKINTFYLKKGINKIQGSFIKSEAPFRLIFNSKKIHDFYNVTISSTKLSDKLDYPLEKDYIKPFMNIKNGADNLWENSLMEGMIFFDEELNIQNSKKIKLTVDGVGIVKVKFMPDNASDKNIFNLLLNKIRMKKEKKPFTKTKFFGVNGKERIIEVNNDQFHDVSIKINVEYPNNMIIKKIEVE